MKRSEMLEKMNDCFHTCGTMGHSIEQAIDRMLEICEENGMTPPVIEVTVKNYYKDGTEFNKFIRVWEDEAQN